MERNTFNWTMLVLVLLVIIAIIWCMPIRAGAAEETIMRPSERHAYWQGGFRGQMIDELMEQARELRQQAPYNEYCVQAWADMKTGAWTMNLTIVSKVKLSNRNTYICVMLLPGVPTPWEYRQKTGKECLMSYYLAQYEWFHGRNGDI